MYRWFGVVPQGGEVFFPSFFVVILEFFVGGVLRTISWGFLVDVTYQDLVPLWLVTLPPNLS
jgi:hypothetical protein